MFLKKFLGKSRFLIPPLVIISLFFYLNREMKAAIDYSKAAGHTGVYVNSDQVWALKARIETIDHSELNNPLGWYTAWPMIVDYKSGRFFQIGYLTSPNEGIDKPTFYVAWSSDGKNINIRYLPSKNYKGNAVLNGTDHEYAMSINIDGSVNIQIDGIKYFVNPSERINIGITEGTGEFFSEGSNINMDISTKFSHCYYKLRGDQEWRSLESDKKLLTYYAAKGTSIVPLDANSFMVQGKITEANRGRFFKEVVTANLNNR